MTKEKNPAAVALGKLGGKKTSEAKKKAAKENIQKRWDKQRESKQEKDV